MNRDRIGTTILAIIRPFPLMMPVYSRMVTKKVRIIMVSMVYRRYFKTFFIVSPNYLYVFV